MHTGEFSVFDFTLWGNKINIILEYNTVKSVNVGFDIPALLRCGCCQSPPNGGVIDVTI